MIMDKLLEFADNQSAAKEAGTANIGDTIDIGNARDIGAGRPLYCVIQVKTAFDGGSGAGGTTRFQIVSDSSAAPSTDGTQTIHAATDVFAAATQLTIRTQLVIPLPSGDNANGKVYERYVGIQAVQASEGEDDGAINAFLTFDPPGGITSHPDANN